jgi:hypothetical protein
MPSNLHIPLPLIVLSPIPGSLSLMAVYISSFQVLRGQPRFFSSFGFQVNHGVW